VRKSYAKRGYRQLVPYIYTRCLVGSVRHASCPLTGIMEPTMKPRCRVSAVQDMIFYKPQTSLSAILIGSQLVSSGSKH
jgi:hypothetical protein